MNFDHNFITLTPLKRIDGEVRYYELPTGERYPSVTSVIGAMSDHSVLDVWRDRIGHDEANKITKMAGRRGSSVHEMCEKFVLNQDIDFKQEMPFNVVMFKQIQKVLEQNVNNIRCSEGMLYSDLLKVAGSVDLVADWQGKVAIIDFKTSIRDKKKEWITSYFWQTCLYAYMLWERTGILCSKIVVVICVEQSLNAQVFVEDTVKWLPAVKFLCEEYHKRNKL